VTPASAPIRAPPIANATVAHAGSIGANHRAIPADLPRRFTLESLGLHLSSADI
jgi:hypothetical protein